MMLASDDAPYFSALYGPSRHAIVVPDLSRVAEQLEGLEDCPEDLYLIEGDPQSFDDSVFSVDELEKAVVVKIADRQWRYSRFPSLPLFGRAARENRIETLHAERESLSERFATLSFDVQKTQRLHRGLQPLYRQPSGGGFRGRSGRRDPQTQQPPRRAGACAERP